MIIEGASAVFGVGCIGGVLAEVLHWWGLRQDDKLPKYVSSPFYWIITLAMVLISGALAWVYFGERVEGILGLNVGLSAPLILQKLATTVPKEQGAKSLIANPAASLRDFFTW